MVARINLLLTFFLCISSFIQLAAQSQGRGIIKGRIVESNSLRPLEYATVSLFSKIDSALVEGMMLDTSGCFSLEVNLGVYYIECAFLGYQSETISNIELKADQALMDLGFIKLKANAQMLTEVEVRAEKSFIELSLDKSVFNVGKDLASLGGNAADILNSVPSVSVDVEGNISLRGSQGVQILVDGKPSGLVARDGLRNLSADMIEKVEVITNPSARYNAEGTAGIINIILKKKRKKGLNGTFNNTIGHPEALATAINLNYRKKKLNLFTNLSASRWRNIGDGAIYREVYYHSDSIDILKSKRDHLFKGRLGSFRIGAEYFINPKNTITTSLFQRHIHRNNEIVLNFQDFGNRLDYELGGSTRTENEKVSGKNQEFALAYKKTFDKEDHHLIADLQIQNSRNITQSTYLETYFITNSSTLPLADLDQLSNTNEQTYQWNAKLDYQLPLKKDEKLEAGLQSSYREISYNYLVEALQNEQWEVFEGLDGEYQYMEKIQAAYALYANKIKQVSFQIGTRLEYADISTSTENTAPRRNLKLFPSAHLTYEFSSKNALQLSYSKRVTRPRLRSLNPLPTFRNSRSRFQGNPDLRPEYTGMYELGYIRNWEKGTISSSLFYRHTEDVIEGVIFKVTLSDPHPVTYRRPENLATKDDIGIELNFSFSHQDWLKLNGNAYFYRAIINGEALNPAYNSDTYTTRGKITSRISISKNTNAQLRFNYRAPFERPQGSRKSQAFLTFSISQKVLRKKGTITLNISDVFNSRISRGTMFTDTFFQEDEFQWSRRTVKLTLYYQLNK